MKTEEEARKSWCPYANVYVPHQQIGSSGNRGLNDIRQGYARCIASECMAWRWCYRPGQVVMVEVPAGTDAAGTVYTNQKPMAGKAEPPIHGYCGLAGKP